MIYLTNQLILKKVFPEWHFICRHEMVFGVEPVLSNPRESIARVASTCTSCEEAREEHKGQERCSISLNMPSKSIILSHFLECIRDLLLRPSQHIECIPKACGVECIGEAGVNWEAIWAYSWRFINLFTFLFIDKSTFDHPPPNRTL